MTLGDNLAHLVLVAQPDLNDGVLGDGEGVEDFLPEHRSAFILDDNVTNSENEVTVGIGRCEVVSSHPVRNLRDLVPAGGINLITTNVEESIREDLGKVLDDVVNEVEGMLIGRVQGASALGRGTDGAIDVAPDGGMSRNIDLSNDTNTSLTSKFDDFLGVLDGVSLVLGESGGGGIVVGDLKREGLVIGDVPVENVELEDAETLNDGLDGLDGKEVAGRIDHHTSVAEEGLILDAPGGLLDHVGVLGGHELDQLGKSVEGVVIAVDAGGGDGDDVGVVGDDEGVGLVNVLGQRTLEILDFDVKSVDVVLLEAGLGVESDELLDSVEGVEDILVLVGGVQLQVLHVDGDVLLTKDVVVGDGPENQFGLLAGGDDD